MKQYAGYLYLFFIFIFALLMFVGTKSIKIEAINLTWSVLIYFVLTRFLLKPFISNKLKDKNQSFGLCFIPIYQELMLFEEGALKIAYIVCYAVAGLFAIFAFAVPYSFYTTLGLSIGSISSVTFVLGVLTVLSLSIAKILFGVRVNQKTWNNYLSLGDSGFYSGVMSISRLITAIFIFVPGVRNVAFMMLLSCSKGE